VEHEYIVRFDGFYAANARKGYIERALAGTATQYTILTRNNPMAGRPSDFDVVRGDLGREELEQLRHHPAVHSVSQEKRLTRRKLTAPTQEELQTGERVQHSICCTRSAARFFLFFNVYAKISGR
jgi:hypothetical protein